MSKPSRSLRILSRRCETRTGKWIRILDIGGGFPVKYHPEVKSFETLAKKLKSEIKRLFPEDMEILAEPGRFLVANACSVVAKVVGKAFRDGKPSYYINDGVYHTYSGQVFDHTLPGPRVQGGRETHISRVRANVRCVRYDHAQRRTARV